jgi:acyl-CoA thioester hydrolase
VPLRDTIESLGIFLPRRVLHAEFFAPARLDDALEVRAYVSHVGTTSLTLNFDIYHADGGALCAASYLVLVCVARGALVKQPLPPPLVAALAPYRLGVDEARSDRRRPRG